MEKIKGSNAVGLYQNNLQNGDIAYFYTLKINGKVQWFKVGTKKNGYGVSDARIARNNKYNEVHNIEKKDTKKLGRKKRTLPLYDEVMNQFVEYKTKNKLKTKTYDNYLGTYNIRVKPFIGNLPIDKITQDDIESIIERHRTSPIKPLSLKSLNTLLDVVRMVYKYARQKDIYNGKDITENIEKFKFDNTRERWLSKDEVTMLLDYTKENVDDKNVYVCILLCVLTGARMNAVVNIKVSDIDLKNKTIKLLDEKKNTNKNYFGYFKDKYFDILKEQVELAQSLNSSLLLTDGSQDKNRGRYYSQRRIQPILDELFNQGVDKKDLKNRMVGHNLRHSFGSILVNSGVDLYTVQKLMNHSDIRMTQRYSKMNDKLKRDGIDNLDF